MRGVFSIFGAILTILGAVMYELLIQLRSETFRADLPPWMDASIAVVGVGLFFIVAGVVLPGREMGRTDVVKASKYLLYAAVLNAIAAAGFSLPVLVPTFEFPILITRWPGIYMVIGFGFFVMVGVLGTFAWSVFYRSVPENFAKESVNKVLFVFHLSALEVGAYLMSIFLFLGGYVGSSLANQGVGDIIVGASMEFAVIPSALGIFLLITSTLAGVANVFLPRKIL